MSKQIIKSIEDKKIIWFKNSNSYLVFEPLVADILSKIDATIPTQKIEGWCSNKLDVPKEVISEFIRNVYSIHNENNSIIKKDVIEAIHFKIPYPFISEKYYLINNCIFKIQFETEFHLLKNHPTFAHLEIKEQTKFDFNYTIFNNNETIHFLKNDILIGKWEEKEAHVFEGKLSMHILIDIYKKPETNWMGVFHASAISNGKESMLFLGDSGTGKSTSLALLNANGFDCIADDFVPIDNGKNVYTYPAAISIKKKSVKTLLPFYPELENSAEFHFKKLNKIVRYLPPKNINYNLKLTCKALIFIKYNPGVEIEISTISKIEAFRQLVPDSWISPLEKNAVVFLDWFLELPCYQLTYSNTKKMINTVSKIFNNEL